MIFDLKEERPTGWADSRTVRGTYWSKAELVCSAQANHIEKVRGPVCLTIKCIFIFLLQSIDNELVVDNRVCRFQ